MPLLDAAAWGAAGFDPLAAEAVEPEDAPVLAAGWGLPLPDACAGLAVAVRNFVGVALLVDVVAGVLVVCVADFSASSLARASLLMLTVVDGEAAVVLPLPVLALLVVPVLCVAVLAAAGWVPDAAAALAALSWRPLSSDAWVAALSVGEEPWCEIAYAMMASLVGVSLQV